VVTFYTSLALDPVRIDRSLQEEEGPGLSRFPFKDPDEPLPDHFPLFFRISDTSKGRNELIFGMDDTEIQVTEHPGNPVGLSFPHQSRIDIDRDQPVTDGTRCKGSADRAVDPS